MSQELDHQSPLLNLADMVSPVSHELRNVFNNMVLTTALLARAVTPELRNQVAEFRAMVLRADEILTRLDQYRQKIVSLRTPINLNEVIEEVVERCQAKGKAVEKQTGAGLPLVMANRDDATRLIEILGGAFQSPIQIRTEEIKAAGQGRVRLTMIGNPASNGEPVHRFFDAFGAPGSAPSHLERAACLTIARRLGTPIRAETHDGGIAVIVEFEPAESS